MAVNQDSDLLDSDEEIVAKHTDNDARTPKAYALTDQRVIRVRGTNPQEISSIDHTSPEVYGVEVEKEASSYNTTELAVGVISGIIGIVWAMVGEPILGQGEALVTGGGLGLVGVFIIVASLYENSGGGHEVTVLLAEPDDWSVTLPEGAEEFADAVLREVGGVCQG